MGRSSGYDGGYAWRYRNRRRNGNGSGRAGEGRRRGERGGQAGAGDGRTVRGFRGTKGEGACKKLGGAVRNLDPGGLDRNGRKSGRRNGRGSGGILPGFGVRKHDRGIRGGRGSGTGREGCAGNDSDGIGGAVERTGQR